MTTEELKHKNRYCFYYKQPSEQALKKLIKGENFDEWGFGVVTIIGDNIGVEYNLCINDGVNVSTIYKLE